MDYLVLRHIAMSEDVGATVDSIFESISSIDGSMSTVSLDSESHPYIGTLSEIIKTTAKIVRESVHDEDLAILAQNSFAFQWVLDNSGPDINEKTDGDSNQSIINVSEEGEVLSEEAETDEDLVVNETDNQGGEEPISTPFAQADEPSDLSEIRPKTVQGTIGEWWRKLILGAFILMALTAELAYLMVPR